MLSLVYFCDCIFILNCIASAVKLKVYSVNGVGLIALYIFNEMSYLIANCAALLANS